MGYIRLIPTTFVVLATFGGLFVIVASLLRARFGVRAIWPFWITYLLLVSTGCIYKLSGLRFGVSRVTIGHTVYLAFVAIVALGVPLAIATLVLIRRSDTTRRAIALSAVTAWLACIATTPIAISLVAIVDFVNLVLVAS
jgi:hypothetical protein